MDAGNRAAWRSAPLHAGHFADSFRLLTREHRHYKYTHGDVPLTGLRFDPENPRLPPQVDSSDVDAVLKFMIDDASLIDLASSIAAQGYFPGEPLLVCPSPELDGSEKPPPPSTDSEYIVVEGNRRLAAVILLANPALAPARKAAIARLAEDGAPERLPVTIFPTRSDILDYLGYRHITGIKEWDPLAKARYLSQVRDRKKELGEESDGSELARLIGSNAPYVGRLLTALRSFERLESLNFFSDNKLEAENLPFAVFSTALNYERIPPWLGIDPIDDESVANGDPDHLLQLATWFFVPNKKVDAENPKPLLRESRNIRWINMIVGNEEATAALEEGVTPVSAAALTQDPGMGFSSALKESARTLRVARRRLPDVSAPTEEDRASVGEIRGDLDQIDAELATKTASDSDA
jgi:hypothetical protein